MMPAAADCGPDVARRRRPRFVPAAAAASCFPRSLADGAPMDQWWVDRRERKDGAGSGGGTHLWPAGRGWLHLAGYIWLVIGAICLFGKFVGAPFFSMLAKF
ncbi:hypothetical protein DAI22_02g242500 [Oryza sativa Japonica Group]|nr:hypothetical protein DAI22_02g242500 [Oryza sativa Japonica Group]